MRCCPATVRVVRALCLVLLLLVAISSLAVIDLSKLPKVVTHDNLKSAGVLKDGVLTVHLELKEGAWHPDADDAPAIPALTITEEGAAPSMPGPMIRVPEGTRVHVFFKNTQFFPIFVFGLNQRPGDAKDAVNVNPGETKEFNFLAGAPGTYFYRASCFAPVPINGLYPGGDTTMTGAFVVDAKGALTDDRVMVINAWYNWLVQFDFEHGFNEILTINGKSWPHTTRLSYTVGDTARWRVINASVIPHPMHLHGAHFRVDSAGDSEKENLYSSAQQRMAVTELMQPGSTMAVTWTPSHAGNWIFHCHLAQHFDAGLADSAARVMGVADDMGSEHKMHDPSGMAGLIMGIEVKPRPGSTEALAKPAQRSLTLTLAKNPPNPETKRQCISMELRDGGKITTTALGSELGPTIILYRDQPTEITVVNKLGQPTAIHWHGIELESYYDGVPGYGGDSRQMTPPIAPGESFIAHMTPPRAGTYIYHTHWHDIGQLTTGLYGAIIVLEPGQKYDPEHDRVFLVSSSDRNFLADALLVNGLAKPGPTQLRVGEKYRLRFINITPSDDSVVYSLLDGGKPTIWQPLAKDGADLPEFYRKPVDAKQTFAAGETYDYIFEPTKPGKLSLETNFALSHIVVPIDVVATQTVSKK
ncbi:MAG TPA: multicopper oxidase domain-containing protein [Terriglobales bacterium]